MVDSRLAATLHSHPGGIPGPACLLPVPNPTRHLDTEKSSPKTVFFRLLTHYSFLRGQLKPPKQKASHSAGGGRSQGRVISWCVTPQLARPAPPSAAGLLLRLAHRPIRLTPPEPFVGSAPVSADGWTFFFQVPLCYPAHLRSPPPAPSNISQGKDS